MLGVVAEEVSQHVDHEHHRAEEVKAGGNDGVPEGLRIDFTLSGWNIDSHGRGDADENAAGEVEEDYG